MKKQTKRMAAFIMAALMTASCFTGCGKKEDKDSKSTETATTEATASDAVDTSATDVSEDEIEIPEGYSLFWHDEFNGTELNQDDWNYEQHEVGWVNHELQEYIPSDE